MNANGLSQGIATHRNFFTNVHAHGRRFESEPERYAVDATFVGLTPGPAPVHEMPSNKCRPPVHQMPLIRPTLLNTLLYLPAVRRSMSSSNALETTKPRRRICRSPSRSVWVWTRARSSNSLWRTNLPVIGFLFLGVESLRRPWVEDAFVVRRERVQACRLQASSSHLYTVLTLFAANPALLYVSNLHILEFILILLRSPAYATSKRNSSQQFTSMTRSSQQRKRC